jgi:hypothetical protein
VARVRIGIPFSKRSRPVVYRFTLLLEKLPLISLNISKRPWFVEIFGKSKFLVFEAVFTKRRLLFEGMGVIDILSATY